MNINHSVSCSKSHKGFILYHVLIFYLFFSSIIASAALLHHVALIQNQYYTSASQKIALEKEVIRLIRKNDTFPINEEITIQSKTVTLMVDDAIKVTICDGLCYKMIITYDAVNDIILGIDYE